METSDAESSLWIIEVSSIGAGMARFSPTLSCMGDESAEVESAEDESASGDVSLSGDSILMWMRGVVPDLGDGKNEVEASTPTRKMKQQEKQASRLNCIKIFDQNTTNQGRLCDYLTGRDTSTMCRGKGHCVMPMRKSAVHRATESCTIATRVEQETQLLPGRERRNEGKEDRERSSRGWICWAFMYFPLRWGNGARGARAMEEFGDLSLALKNPLVQSEQERKGRPAPGHSIEAAIELA
jgi:hypothetical protein